MKIINDIHIGVSRSGGTTPTSAKELRSWVIQQFKHLVEATNEDLCILGDLFDTHTIPLQDLLETYKILLNFVASTQHHLLLVRGNHDLNTDSSKLSSFDVLGQLLSLSCDKVRVITEPTQWGDCYIIPHLVNQDAFNKALDEVPEASYLLVHANYDNHFAVESDHSLNLSKEQALALPVQHIVFAHEHGSRTELDCKVLVIGNQVPTSVSDYLSGQTKQWMQISGETHKFVDMPPTISNSFVRMDWKDMFVSEAKFIRVEGECTKEEAPDMANAISSYRKTSDAFIISNAVKVEKDKDITLESLESIEAFDLMKILEGLLTEKELEIVKDIL